MGAYFHGKYLIISIRNKLTQVYSVYMVNKQLQNQILSIVLSSEYVHERQLDDQLGNN